MIRGYTVPSSVLPGETLTFHVSTDRPQFRVEIYRQGESLIRMEEGLDWQRGYHADKAPMGEDWCWPCYGFTIPVDWQSGVYIARFIEGDRKGHPIEPPSDIDSTNGLDKALFVVRSASPGESASILYKVPLFTYHAYAWAIVSTDDNGQENLYDNRYNGSDPRTAAKPVTLHRPGGGTGEGYKVGVERYDFYDREAYVCTFEHFDAKFVRWLEMNGYKIDYCTDLDVHENPDDFLAHYRLLLIGGHDEYWSEDERHNVEDFVHNGGNLAIFSGNTCWFRVQVLSGNTAILCNKASITTPGPDVDFGRATNVDVDTWFANNPENSLTGVSFRRGGEWHTAIGVGYTVQHADHWIFAGTHLNNGDIFGDEEHLIFGEFDSADFAVDPDSGYKVPTGRDGTPSSFTILGYADSGAGTATMGLYSNGGIVFNAATLSWPRVLACGDSHVNTITRNVLNHLGLRAVRIIGPLPTVCGSPVAVEGRTASFQVDTRDIGDSASLSYQWSISAGEASFLDRPVFEARMPSPLASRSVTVTVRITGDEGKLQGFGTLTFMPLTERQAMTLGIACLTRDIMPIPHSASIEDGVWHRLLSEDPLRFARKFQLDKKNLEVILQKAKHLQKLTSDLMKLQAKK